VRHRLLLLVCLLAACSKETAKKTEPKSREARCDAIVTQAGQQAQMVMGALAVSLGDGTPEDARRAAADAKAEMRGELDALRKQCLEWPERTVDCFDDPVFAALHQDECEQASAVAFGQTVPIADVKPGPEPAWTFTFPAKPEPLLVRDDGWALARTIEHDEDYKSTYRLTAIREGTLLWQVEKQTTAQLLDLGERGVAVVAEGQLEFLNPATGEVTRTVRPSGKDTPDFDPEWSSQPYVVLVAQDGEDLWVADTEARFYRVDVEGNEAKYEGRLPEESLDSGARLWIFGERRWLWEDYDLRVFDAQWSPIASMRAHDFMGSVEVDETGATLIVDGEVVRLNASACKGSRTFAVSGWPHRGDLVMGDECEDCGRAPTGCIAWSKHISDVSNAPVARLADGAAVVSDGEKTVALREGEELWSAGTMAAGPAAAGTNVFVVSVEETRWRLWSLDAKSGTAQWATERPADDSALYNTDDIQLQLAGDWVFAGYDRELIGLKP